MYTHASQESALKQRTSLGVIVVGNKGADSVEDPKQAKRSLHEDEFHHASLGIGHAPLGITSVGVAHGPVAVAHGPVAVAHGPVAIDHAAVASVAHPIAHPAGAVGVGPSGLGSLGPSGLGPSGLGPSGLGPNPGLYTEALVGGAAALGSGYAPAFAG